jgi:hypothetical protein
MKLTTKLTTRFQLDEGAVVPALRAAASGTYWNVTQML